MSLNSSPLLWAERLSDLDDDELDEYIQKGVKGDKDDIKIEGLGTGDDDDDEVLHRAGRTARLRRRKRDGWRES
jgi:hypothetical protein